MKALRPMLEFSSTVWNSMTKQNFRKVESVQKRITKRLVGLSKISSNRRLEMLNIESLEERRLRSDLIMCYKILRGFVNLDRYIFCASRK